MTQSELEIKESYLNKINFDQTIFVVSEKYIPLRYKTLFYNQFNNIVKNLDKNKFFAASEILLSNFFTRDFENQADFHINKLPDLIEEFVDTGKAKIVFRDFPFNYPALLGSKLLRCVPEDIRYEYASALYQLQSNWVVQENAKSKKVYKYREF